MNQRKKTLRGVLLLVIIGMLGASWIMWDIDIKEENDASIRFRVKASVENVTPVSLEVEVDNLGVDGDSFRSLKIDDERIILKEATAFGWRKIKNLNPNSVLVTATPSELVKKLTLSWDTSYGKLPRGIYRIDLPISITGDSSDNLVGYWYATFKVTK